MPDPLRPSPSPAALEGYLHAVTALEAPPEVLLRGLVGQLRNDGDCPARLSLPPIPAGLATPWLLGQVREVLHERHRRTALGAWFTPAALARSLVDLARPASSPRTVLDPACGGGAFLLAAHERYPDALLAGRDVDPVAVEVTRAAVELAGCTTHDVAVGDGLDVGGAARYDLVVGNPPFLSQMRSATARDAGRRAALVARFGGAAAGYVDEAALFVLAVATELLVAGGVAVLVVPEALLATSGAADVRGEVGRHCTVEVVWRDEDRTFPQTPTCALRLVRHSPALHPTPPPPPAPPPPAPPPPAPRQDPDAPAPQPDKPGGGGAAEPRAEGGGPSWGYLLADDVPAVRLPPDLPTVADEATATAEFRDTHYGLAAHARERQEDEGDPIVTVGLIDPAHLRWGEVDVRFAKQRWRRPVAVDLPDPLRRRLQGPKVLLATQSRVLEALVDETGDLLPSTPVISLRGPRLWHLAAALTSPVLTAIAARRHAGAARSRGAIKLSAQQVLALPLPQPGADWDAAADAVRAATAQTDPATRHDLLRSCGEAMSRAYGVDDDALLRWWLDRLPRRPRT